jgi:hypothetical protein
MKVTRIRSPFSALSLSKLLLYPEQETGWRGVIIEKILRVVFEIIFVLKIRYAVGLHFQDSVSQNILKFSTLGAEITSSRRAAFIYYGLNTGLTSDEAKCRLVCH